MTVLGEKQKTKALLPSERRPVSTAVTLVGLFTVSWDRFANIEVAGFNVKISTVAFALALILTAVDATQLSPLSTRRISVVRAALITFAIYAGMTVFAVDQLAALKQAVTVLLGAVVPFLAVVINMRMFGQLDRLLTWFIRGGWVAAVFGLYQLAAFYTGLPQIVSYEATGGGLGRISAFSYEAAYFGYFVVLVVGAIYARATLRGETVSRLHLGFFFLVLILANSRAVFFTVPLLLLFLYASWPKGTTRAKLWPAAIVAVWAAAFVLLLRPGLLASLAERVQSIFDTREATSNVPRLAVYDTSLAIIQDHWLSGIGAGNLIRFAPMYGLPIPEGSTSNSVIANNAWLQAALDGGVILLAAQLLFVVIAVAALYRRRHPAARMLMAGWLATFLVSSMLTSYYFNASLWVVMGLAVSAAAGLDGRDRGADVRV